MSLQDSLTSSGQGKANWNSRRPLFLVCAGLGGEPLPVWASLLQPASNPVCRLQSAKGIHSLSVVWGPGGPKPSSEGCRLACPAV